MNSFPYKSEDKRNVLKIINKICTLILILEILIKIIGIGMWSYLSHYFNLFDFIVTVIAMIELFIQSEFTVFSTFRSLKLLKLFYYS